MQGPAVRVPGLAGGAQGGPAKILGLAILMAQTLGVHCMDIIAISHMQNACCFVMANAYGSGAVAMTVTDSLSSVVCILSDCHSPYMNPQIMSKPIKWRESGEGRSRSDLPPIERTYTLVRLSLGLIFPNSS